MITAAQAQAYRATGDRKYIDRAAREMVVYLDELQKPNGLFYHAPDVPFFWGRGNGWMAAGMAELLRSLPQDSPQRPRIMEGYKLMMSSLLEQSDSVSEAIGRYAELCEATPGEVKKPLLEYIRQSLLGGVFVAEATDDA